MEPFISDAHRKCFLSFVELLSAIENPVRDFRDQAPLEDVVEEFGKYKLWAGNVGAAHSGKRYEISLDYRLKEASFYKTQTGTDLRLAHKVLKLLGTLDNMVAAICSGALYRPPKLAVDRRLGSRLDHCIVHYIAKVPPNFLALSLIQGKRKPFEELSLSDYPADSTTPSEDGSDDQAGADDSPWEVSSDSGDEGQLEPEDSTRLTRKRGTLTTQAATAGTQDSGPAMHLVQRSTTEMPQLLESIKFTIACLYKLPIRRPAPLDRLKQKSSTDASFYQPFDVLYIQDKLPQLDLRVAMRLGKMISRRRQLLFYLHSHEKNLETAKVEPKTIQADPAIVGPSPPEKSSSGLGVVREAAASVVSSQQPPLTKATTFRINTIPAEALDTLYAPSLAESASTAPSSYAGETLRVEVPPRPKGKNGKDLDFFKCPYCLTTKHIKNDRAWKKHVLKDLRPYVCTFPDCDLLEHFFDNRGEWYKHEVQQHRVEWFCNIEGDLQFTELSDFLEHMESAHDTKFNAGDRSLLSMFRRPSQSSKGICNLCLRPSSNLKSHISRHLEQIALFALPRANGAMSSETELKSDFSGRNIDGSVNRDEIQWKPGESKSSQTASHSEMSKAEELQSGEPDICDPVDQVIVPDEADLSWDTITTKFSEARKGFVETAGSGFEPEQILELYQGPEDQIHKDIVAKISPLDFSTMQNGALSRHQSGTGEWLFETDAFKNWLTGIAKTLLCRGSPGVGKTVLSSIVVDYLEHHFRNEDVAVIYVYCSCNHQEDQTAINLVSSLLQQLIKKNSVISKGVLAAYQRSPNERLTIAEYFDLLESEAGRFSKVFIIVDALDECSKSNGTTFVGEIKRLQSQLATIYLFATSRYLLDSDYSLGRSLHVEIHPNDEDIKSYVSSRIERELQLMRLTKEQQEIITERSIEVAGGLFLRAQLFLDSISSSLSIQTLQQALASLPQTLDDVYMAAMQRVESQDQPAKDLAKGALSWIFFTLSPLSVRQLQHALIINPEDTGIGEGVVPDAELIVSVCVGLITIHSDGTFGFSHFTIKEYFEHTHMISLPDAHARVAIACLSYISFDVFADGPCQNDQEMEIRLDDYPLLTYASRYWSNHAYGDMEEVVKELATKFLGHPAKVSCSTQAASLPGDRFHGYSQSFLKSETGLHIAASKGLVKILQLLLQQENVDVNVLDDHHRTPLSWAAAEGHEAVVRLLLTCDEIDVNLSSEDQYAPLLYAAQKGHEVVVQLLLACSDTYLNPRSVDGRTPLSWAAGGGLLSVVQLLLKSENTDISAIDIFGRSPLWWAAAGGQGEVVEQLLKCNGIDPNLGDSDGRSPLSVAAEYGFAVVVQQLLKFEDIHINSGGDTERTPLSWAAEGGHEAVVRLLLACRGILANSKDRIGRTPLSWAAQSGQDAVVQVLLACDGIEVNSKDNYGRTPLWWAARSGQGGAVRVLLGCREIDADSKDRTDRTPLSWAAEGGHDAVIQLLLAHNGIDANSKDRISQTPLSWAAGNGREGAVRLLLTHEGIDVNHSDSFGRTPLWWATWGGHEAVVQLLLTRRDVDPNPEGRRGRTPLSWAAMHGCSEIVGLLLGCKGIDVNSKDESDRTPLLFAARNGHETVVSLLLEFQGTDVNSRDKDGRTPLLCAVQGGRELVARKLLARRDIDADSKDKFGEAPLLWAAESGQEAVVQLLLEYEGTDVNSRDGCERTALWWAAWGGHGEVVRLLLTNRDIDVNAKDVYGRVPLWWAARNGHEAVVRLLLECKDIKVESEDADGMRPLGWAARDGHESVVHLLLEFKDIDVNPRDKTGRTPLSWLAGNGHETAVQLLLKCKDIDINAGDNNGRTALLWAAENGHETVVRLLLEFNGIDVNPRDDAGRTLLLWAAERGHEEIVRLLLRFKDISVNARDHAGRTPLSRFAGNGHGAAVQLLLRCKDIDINAGDNRGRTPLLWAAENGHEAVVQLLLECKDIDINAGDHRDQTPLSLAAESGRVVVVKLLLGCKDIDINAEDKNRLTPLAWAAINGRKAVVEQLLAHGGADVNSRDGSGRTPLHLAAANGRGETVQLLLKCEGINVNAQDNQSQTPLSSAAENGHEQVVRLLLECKDTITDLKDNSGKTPLSLAQSRGHKEVVHLLAGDALAD